MFLITNVIWYWPTSLITNKKISKQVTLLNYKNIKYAMSKFVQKSKRILSSEWMGINKKKLDKTKVTSDWHGTISLQRQLRAPYSKRTSKRIQ